jgi:hypothetical protein
MARDGLSNGWNIKESILKSKLINQALLPMVFSVAALSSSVALADDNYGCQALLCFAGGKGVAECASTIRQVTRDLAKGKGFPHCSFVSPGGSNPGDYNTSGVFTRWLGKNNNVCPDGETRGQWKSGKGFRCQAMILTIKGAAEDGSDVVREINW